MANQSQKRDETDSYESSTRLLSDSIHQFKRPSRKSKKDVTLEMVRFILPNAQSVEVPAGNTLVMGRKTEEDGEVNFDLSVLYGADSGISRKHAIVQINDEAVFVRDYDSRNGTFLNGEELYPMRDYAINDGDELRLGQVTMRVIFV